MAESAVEYVWYAALAVESLLFALLWFRNAPRYFSVLIGADCIAQILQIVFYRSNYHELARIFGRTGDIILAPLCALAVIEAADLDSSRFRWWHLRILAVWIAGAKLCGWMEVGQPDSVIGWWNGVLLSVQVACFAGWIALFISE